MRSLWLGLVVVRYAPVVDVKELHVVTIERYVGLLEIPAAVFVSGDLSERGDMIFIFDEQFIWIFIGKLVKDTMCASVTFSIWSRSLCLLPSYTSSNTIAPDGDEVELLAIYLPFVPVIEQTDSRHPRRGGCSSLSSSFAFDSSKNITRLPVWLSCLCMRERFDLRIENHRVRNIASYHSARRKTAAIGSCILERPRDVRL